MRMRNALLGTVAAATVAVTALGLTLPAHGATALRALAEAKGRYFGTALTAGDLGNATESSVAAAQFDMVTPGNEMKWDTTEPSNGSYNFGPGDRILSFGQSHNMRVRGHNLVWHSQLPSWVSNLPLNQVQGVMESHITTEATHYKGKVYAWDVINEPYNEDGTLRQDVFYRAMGTGYLADALRTAHAADPDAKLYINDYNIEGLGAKSNGLYTLAQSLVSQGVPLGGIGFESHFIVGQVPSSLLANMQRFAALGLDVAITELDDRIPLPASSANLQQQATDYRNVVDDCLAVPRCVGVSQWGVDDGHSWIPGTFPGYGAATFYDANYQPKPAYNAVVTALSTGPSPSPSPSATRSASPSASPSASASVSASASASASVSASASASASASVSSQPVGACSASYRTVGSWPGGFQGEVTVTAGGAPINGWTVRWNLASGQAITQVWSGTLSTSGSAVTVHNASYNGTVPASGSTTFGFIGTGAPSTPTLSCTSP